MVAKWTPNPQDKVRFLRCVQNEQVANIGIGTGLQNLKYEFDSHSVLYGAEANLVEALDWKSKGVGSQPTCTTIRRWPVRSLNYVRIAEGDKRGETRPCEVSFDGETPDL